MLAEFFRSPALVEVVLLLMLLAWLTASAVMTVRSGRRSEEPEAPRREVLLHPTFPPAVRAITGAPRR